MIGARNRHIPTVDVPPWPYCDDQYFMLSSSSPNSNSISTPNNTFSSFVEDDYASLFFQHDVEDSDEYELNNNREIELPVDVYACDNFRMYEFKVRRCGRGRSHDWTECPYVHPGEKARRRDPRKYHYSGTACPDFRKGNCNRGDSCEFAHGVFECWLHPFRYRTQPCKDGVNCKRRVCFFAHSPEQLRVLGSGMGSDSIDNNSSSSPRRYVKTLHFVSSPESSSPPTESSPPMSPAANSFNSLSRSLGSNSVNEVMASLRQLQLNRLNSMPSSYVQMGSPVLGSPRRPVIRPGFYSLPATPSGDPTRPRNRCFDLWENGECEEEPVMERVESGRDLRVKMFERLSKENPLDDRADPNPDAYLGPGQNPDVGWVSDLIQ